MVKLKGSNVRVLGQLISQESQKSIDETISIIIPCYLQAEFIEEAINSILNQTILPKQVLILLMDEKSWALRATLESMSPLVRCYITDRQYLPAARNFLIKQVETPYVIPLDADDMLLPNFIYQVTRMLPADVVYVGSRTFGDFEEIWDCPATVELDWLKEDNCIPNTALIKVDAWRSVGGYNEMFTFGYEDWEFWLHLLKYGKVFKKCSDTYLLYRKHGATLLQEANKRRNDAIRMIQTLHSELHVVGVSNESSAEELPIQLPPALQKKSVSVIIPCYKQAHFVEEAVRSAIDQTYLPDEVIVILMDQKSWRMKEHLEGLSTLVRCINANQKLLPAARNFAYGVARSEYVLPLDSDDTLPSNFIEEVVKIDADVVYVGARCIPKKDGSRWSPGNDTWPAQIEEEADWDLMMTFRKNSLTYSSLVRRSAWEAVGGYNDNLTSFEDYEFWMHLHLAGFSFQKCTTTHLNYRVVENSMLRQTLAEDGKSQKLYKQIMNVHQAYFNRIPKIIHYVWVGDQSKKPVDNIEQWKEIMPEPEWTYIEWSERNIDFDSCLFLRQAYEAKKYGITVDPLRAQILYKFGGIYLDADVTINNSLEPFLQYDFFGGYESQAWVMAGTIGASPGLPMMKWLQDVYNRIDLQDFTVRNFLDIVRTGPVNITQQLQKVFPEWTPDGLPYTGVDSDGRKYRIEPPPVFTLVDPFLWTNVGRNYTVQLYAGSWLEGEHRFGEEIRDNYLRWKEALALHWEDTASWLKKMRSIKGESV